MFIQQQQWWMFVRNTTILVISVNTGQICIGVEADKTEKIAETCPSYKTFGQRSDLKVIDVRANAV